MSTKTTPDLSTIVLSTGSHSSRKAGTCVMEAVAYVAREPHSDHPRCASPVLGAFGRTLNDALPDDKRQRLVSLVPLLVGTAGDGKDEIRGWIAIDWIVRTYTPTFLRLVPDLVPAAEALEQLTPITGEATLRLAMEDLTSARKGAAAARDAAGAAAWDAARAAAWDAARAAARDAAWAAAWAAARAAAWDAAWDAARAAAGDAARAAAGDAARDAAWDALKPTVSTLQDSTIELFERLIEARG